MRINVRKILRQATLPLVIMVGVLLFAFPALSQDTGQPPDSMQTELEEARALLAEAQALADEARALSDEARNAYDVANSMFGLFEAMSGAVGLVVPFLAVVAAFIGFRRLENAQTELRAARERFETDIRHKEEQLDKLRVELQETAESQRVAAGKASLALSLLPLGERQYRAQDYQGALDTYGRALKLDPDNPIIHYRMGYVYTQSGELDEAETHFSTSLELDPEFSPSRAARGYVYRRKGDQLDPGVEQDIVYNKAEENFLAALNVQPKLIDEDDESWWGALGGLYRRRGQVEQAIMAYRRAAEVTPHSSYPFSNLALLYMIVRDRTHMIETYKRVEQLAWNEVQADVDNYWAYADLIVSRLALGKIKQAEDILETALDTAPPDSPYALESLLDTLRRLADVVEPQDRPPIIHVMTYIEGFKQRRSKQKRVLEN